MRKAKAKHGIVQNAIFGYDSAACISLQDNSTPIEEHVGFKVLLGHFIEENPAFKPWTGGKPLLKRGRLLKAAERIGHTVQPENVHWFILYSIFRRFHVE
jgi:hypothetical protein